MLEMCSQELDVVHEPGPPALPHLSLFSLLGVYMLFINVFIYKPFPSWKKAFALEREIPFR